MVIDGPDTNPTPGPGGPAGPAGPAGLTSLASLHGRVIKSEMEYIIICRCSRALSGSVGPETVVSLQAGLRHNMGHPVFHRRARIKLFQPPLQLTLSPPAKSPAVSAWDLAEGFRRHLQHVAYVGSSSWTRCCYSTSTAVWLNRL